MKKIIFLFMLLMVSRVYADNSVGCGLGSMIITKNSIVSATFRATTNMSFSSQLFGITSGTSGCAQHSIVKNEMAPQYFAEANLEQLKPEMAQGEGEYLMAFAETLGCKEDVKSEFYHSVKNNFGEIFKNDNVTASEMLGNVKKVIKQNKVVQGQCQFAII